MGVCVRKRCELAMDLILNYKTRKFGGRSSGEALGGTSAAGCAVAVAWCVAS